MLHMAGTNLAAHLPGGFHFWHWNRLTKRLVRIDYFKVLYQADSTIINPLREQVNLTQHLLNVSFNPCT